jgi:hypothetical protein
MDSPFNMLSRFALLVVLATIAASGGACTGARSPELRVIGVHDAPRRQGEVVFVQVTNPAARPMRLTKLEYRFAAGASTISQGEVELDRDVPANAAIVVEVPLEISQDKPVTLTGKLTAELDQIVRIFKVSASVTPNTQPK